jgi:signal peptidase I
LLIPVVQEGNGLRVHFLPRSGYKYLVWPTVFRHYELEVGGERVSLELPQEFPLDPVVMEGLFARWVDDLEKWRWRMGAYFARALVVDSLRNIDANISGDIEAQMEEARERGILPGSFEQQIELARVRGLIARTESVAIPNSSQRLTVFWLRALGPEGNPLTFEEGEPVLDFDILTGDMLFVDRFSYHFSRPEIGDPFVFQTRDIGGLVVNGQPDDKYYIKRLVGKGGDRLRVDEPVLLRNGQPITGAEVFARQANPEDSRYRGYEARGWLSPGNIEEIPEDFFYAMGDNSPESSDSRLWGTNTIGASFRMRQRKAAGEPINFVPEKAVVGEALFIFYPFTERWGPAE